MQTNNIENKKSVMTRKFDNENIALFRKCLEAEDCSDTNLTKSLIVSMTLPCTILTLVFLATN